VNSSKHVLVHLLFYTFFSVELCLVLSSAIQKGFKGRAAEKLPLNSSVLCSLVWQKSTGCDNFSFINPSYYTSKAFFGYVATCFTMGAKRVIFE
jgi:hypothetical protein